MRFTYGAAAWLFLRLLGVVYFVAFASLGVQIVGLVGPHGILPGPAWATAVTLHVLTAGGAALAVLLVVGVTPIPVLVLLWADYLLLSIVSGEFLSYQWDALLLETGLIAVFFAPAVWRDRADRLIDPPRVARWLTWWLLFRLMLASGAVKLASGDPTWLRLLAMSFHYETQPIPTPLAWYAHQLPLWFQETSTAVVLAIELGAPWCIFAPRRVRLAGFVLLASLQVLIALTGNFAFFNLLAIALCVLLLDDRVFRKSAAVFVESSIRRGATIAFAVVTVPVSVTMFCASIGIFFAPPPVGAAADAISRLRSVNGYGLFAVMTTWRDEIVVEGSNDGAAWLPYEFRYKPGATDRRPPWVAPHQPRLDWQMWFASLTTYDRVPWYGDFLRRLLEGSPDVLALLASNPFPGRPPRYVRGEVYRYHYGRTTWWTRERLAEYSPPMTLGDGGTLNP